MRVMSLFAGGAAGFDLAARWMGWTTAVMVEKDEHCQKLLRQNFPESKLHGDIYTFDGTPYRNTVDLICGGFPCQPWSMSGKRKGTADERHLWPEMLRVIKSAAPGWVVGENVPGIITTERQLDHIIADLEGVGYTVRPFVVSSQCVGGLFDGKRVFIVAQADGERRSALRRNRQLQTASSSASGGHHHRGGTPEFIAGQRRQIESRPYGVADGIPHRVDRNQIIGNAVDPHLVYQIFQAIQHIEDQS